VKLGSAVKIVLTTMALHNNLRTKAGGRFTPPDSIDREDCNGIVNEGSWRGGSFLEPSEKYSKFTKRMTIPKGRKNEGATVPLFKWTRTNPLAVECIAALDLEYYLPPFSDSKT